MAEKRKGNALAIAIMFFLFMMISFVTGLQNPFGIIVKQQFSATNFMSQLGNAANFIAYAFMGVPAGIILSKKGYKFTALLAVLVGFIGVGITFLSGKAGSKAKCGTRNTKFPENTGNIDPLAAEIDVFRFVTVDLSGFEMINLNDIIQCRIQSNCIDHCRVLLPVTAYI